MSLALVAVQVRLELEDLASPEVFRDRMLQHGQRAADASAGAAHRLFVFPENLGHFATLAFAPSPARRRSSVDGALAVYAATRPFALARAAWSHRQLSLKQTAMLALTPRSEALMRDAFADIARRHRATVVAGSMLRVSRGRVRNSSATFAPDGRLCAVTDKVNLVPDAEDASPAGLGLARGDADALPVVDAPWGSLATLICYDGFCESHTRHERFAHMGRRADAAGVDVIANPSANPWPWNGPWFFAEPDEDILRRDQWRSEGLPATLAALRHVRYGVTAHLAGELLDQQFEGRSEILERRGQEAAVLAQATTIDESEVVVAHVPNPG